MRIWISTVAAGLLVCGLPAAPASALPSLAGAAPQPASASLAEPVYYRCGYYGCHHRRYGYYGYRHYGYYRPYGYRPYGYYRPGVSIGIGGLGLGLY